MNKAKTKPIELAFPAEGHPIIEIKDDKIQKLSILLKFNNNNIKTILTFKKVIDYNTLNNEEINKYWNNNLGLSSWFWNEQDLEWKEVKKNKDILDKPIDNIKTEYLILGENESIRVVSFSVPTLENFK